MATPYIVSPKLGIPSPKECKTCTNGSVSIPNSPLKHRIGTCGFSCTEWCSVCEDHLKSGFKDQSGNSYPDRTFSDVLRLQNPNRNDRKLGSLERVNFDYDEKEKLEKGDIYWSYPRCANNICPKQWAPNRVHEKYLREVEALRGKLRELRGTSTRKLPMTPSEAEFHRNSPYITQNDLKLAENVAQHSDAKRNRNPESETKRNRHSSESEATIQNNSAAASAKRLREKSPLVSIKTEESPKIKQSPEKQTEQKLKSSAVLPASHDNKNESPPKNKTIPQLSDASTSCTDVKAKSTKITKPIVAKRGRSLSYTVGTSYTIPPETSSYASPSYAVGDSLEQISLDDKTPSPPLSPLLEGQSFIRPSLFPHVPPYLRFISHDAKVAAIPKLIQRNLKWKLSTITPLVVRHTVQNSGFKLVRRTNDWLGIWGRHMKSICFKTLKDYQKINHIPGTFQIGRKDRLWKNLFRLMTKFGKKEFGFIPRTFILPQDVKMLRQAWDRTGSKSKWIVKPPASARGTGIKVVHKWGQIPKKVPIIVQKYISNPYLINGNKFDLRLYVLVPTFNPLRIYLYDNGLVRFASVKYSDEASTLNNRYMHLTNYSINKLSNNYAQNEDAEACTGHKWTIKSLWTYLEGSVNMDALWSSLEELVIKTMISGESSIGQLSNTNLTSRYCSYELFGVDVLLDENLKPWLLEVNISPSLHSSSPLDLAVKGPMVKDLLNIAGFQIPNKLTTAQQEEFCKKYNLEGQLCYDHRLFVNGLSPAEKSKQSYFDKVEYRDLYIDSILADLTPDDVRHLIVYEDELTQIGDFQKIFPTEKSHSFLQYFEGNRYYNYLFDAWESKYYNNRIEGIKLLKEKCHEQIHLDLSGVEPRNSSPYLSDTPNPLDDSRSGSQNGESGSDDVNTRVTKKSKVSRLVSAKYRYSRLRKTWPIK